MKVATTDLGARTADGARDVDLLDLVSAARDAGHEVMLFERGLADAVSVAGIGRRYDIVSTEGGVALEDREGRRLDQEEGSNRLLAAGRLWRRLAGRQRNGLVAMGGCAFDPEAEPREPWLGFPGLLFRVPAVSVMRARGKTVVRGDTSLLELGPQYRAPSARRLSFEPVRPESEWLEAVAGAARQLREGRARKVVLAREVMVRGDGVLSAGEVARALRGAYPACFTYLITGADGTAFTGASPELLVRRSGRAAVSQPMAGSIGRGRDEAEDSALARQLFASSKNTSEHAVTARFVAGALGPFSDRLEVGRPEVVRFTNIQHLATTVNATLREPAPNLLELAATLHPTPAVNGDPALEARQLIAELEGIERGWYAGAVGWLDSGGDGELAVAIRCGLLWEDGARLYAGNGMMPDSDPESELRETELKLRALADALTA